MSLPSWMHLVARRFMTYVVFKAIGTTFGISFFFVAYFWVMEHPAPFAELRVVPMLAIDHWIPVQEWALIPYASLWFYVCISSALIDNRREMLEYLVGVCILCVAGIGIFWLYPTTVPDFGVDWQLYPALEFLKNADGGANALPSLHAAFAVFTAAFLNTQLRVCNAPPILKISNILWAALIVYSTMATRQHVFLDALAGTALGLLAFAPLRCISNACRRAVPAGMLP